MPAQDPFCVFLNEKFKEKKERNSSYSLRAFAKLLEVDQSTLTKVMKSQRQFLPETRGRIINKLAGDAVEAHELFAELDRRQGNYRTLEDEITEMISNWHFWAILEILKIPDFKHTTQDLVARLGISLESAEEAVKRLEILGFLKIEKPHFILLDPNTSWATTLKTTTARKALQRSFLDKSQNALEEIPFELRDHSSITLAIDVDRMTEFKEKLTEMRREFGRFAQKSGTFTEVYTLTLSLFPLTKK